MARVAIIGAGPAGASAARHLAARGHDVTLIDRAEFPRPKTCGDWITLGSVAELQRLGLSRTDLERLAVHRAPITGTVLVAPDGRRTMSTGRAVAYCIPRLVFDAMLWRHAVGAGCRPVRRNVRDIGAGDGAFLRDWDHVIDARGTQAGDPNAVALRAYWTVRRDTLDAGEEALVQIHTDALFRRGYGWIFPVSGDAETMRFNVGVGLWAGDSRPGRHVRDFYDRFVEHNPVLRRWSPAAARERPVGCHVGLGVGSNVVAARGVLRIGDAANLADPLTGDGIGNALASGRLVADAIDGSADGAAAAARWQALHDESFVREFRIALTIRRALTATTAKNAAARLLAAVPCARARVHAAFFGEASYGSIATFQR